MNEPLEAIRRVIDAFERSSWSEIDVRWGDVRVHLATDPFTTDPPAASSAAPPTPEEAQDTASHAGSTEGPIDGQDIGPITKTTPAVPTNAAVVVSPSPGIVWRSPEPGAPPFADIGQTVAAADTLCIVEIMKLMSHIKAGVSGEVIAVYGENGVAVDKGQPLFVIAPSGSSS